MKSKFLAFAAALCGAICAILSSCDVTGDPSTGGIFWSENKAQGRLAERQDKLERIEKLTGKNQRKSAETQRKIDELGGGDSNGNVANPGAVPDPRELPSPAKDY